MNNPIHEKYLCLHKKPETAKADFFQNMQQEIFRPLSGIIELSDDIADLTSDKKIHQNARYIFESSSKLLELLNTLFENIHFCSNPLNLIDFEYLLHDLKKTYQPVVFEKKLNLCIENRIKWIFSDAEKIHAILSEMLSNASKFTFQGNITVTTLLKKNSLILNVSDTGRGIPENKLSDIFKGRGLSNIQKYLDDLSGHLNVLSEVEKGSSFVCTIPLPKKPDLLLIEDSPVAILAGQFEFEKKGFHVITAETVQEALEKINQQPYALIVTDIDLPDGRGDALARKIRQEDSPNKKTPIIALTSRTAYEVIGLDTREVFQKPLTPEKADAIAERAGGLEKYKTL